MEVLNFLIYIPCHSDILAAIKQGKDARSQFQAWLKINSDSRIELKLILSINSYQATEEEKKFCEQVFDKIIDYESSFLADVNISQGFMVALLEKPKYFWLLSTNDYLQPSAIATILDGFEEDCELDLIAINGSGLEGSFYESEILNPPRSQMSYGVISGVIYNFEKMWSFFNSAPFLPWTGWSQLSVIEGAIRVRGYLKIRTFPHFLIYTQNERSTKESGKYYAHSFYGMLLLGVTFETKKRDRNKFIRSFIFRNFYNINLYSRDVSLGRLIDPENYLRWNQILAEALIKSTDPITHLSYLILKRINFVKFEKIRILKLVKRRLDSFRNMRTNLDLRR